jgi:sec-independent protein translocase protein TatA
MPNIGGWEIAIVVVLLLIIFGPKKLPELGSSLGKSIRGFRKGLKENKDEVKSTVSEVREAVGVDEVKSAVAEVREAAGMDQLKTAVKEVREAAGVDELQSTVREVREVANPKKLFSADAKDVTAPGTEAAEATSPPPKTE